MAIDRLLHLVEGALERVVRVQRVDVLTQCYELVRACVRCGGHHELDARAGLEAVQLEGCGLDDFYALGGDDGGDLLDDLVQGVEGGSQHHHIIDTLGGGKVVEQLVIHQTAVTVDDEQLQ